MNAEIEALTRRAAASRDVLSLAGGLPLASLFPLRDLNDSFQHMNLAERQQALQYGWPEGSPDLRAWIAERLRQRAAAVQAEHVIITSGAQQALAIAVGLLGEGCRSLGVQPETYPGALNVFRRAELSLMPNGTPDAHYVVDGASNPYGRGLDPVTRQRLLDSGRPLIVDEAYAELRFDGELPRPLLCDAPDRTFHIGTFSKTLAPGLRVGWLIAPEDYRDAALEAKHSLDLEAPTFTQALLAGALVELDWEAHLKRARVVYRERIESLLAALRKHLPELEWHEPEGGFTVFGSSRQDSLDELELLRQAVECGTCFDPGSLFRHDGATTPLALRLSPCNVEADQIEPAVKRLARAARNARAVTSA